MSACCVRAIEGRRAAHALGRFGGADILGARRLQEAKAARWRRRGRQRERRVRQGPQRSVRRVVKCGENAPIVRCGDEPAGRLPERTRGRGRRHEQRDLAPASSAMSQQAARADAAVFRAAHCAYHLRFEAAKLLGLVAVDPPELVSLVHVRIDIQRRCAASVALSPGAWVDDPGARVDAPAAVARDGSLNAPRRVRDMESKVVRRPRDVGHRPTLTTERGHEIAWQGGPGACIAFLCGARTMNGCDHRHGHSAA